ncbi:MAG: hypothetical protein LRY40_09460 [Shewanella fodinae]|nr:hypothetical protein [Shewanella fodinae]
MKSLREDGYSLPLQTSVMLEMLLERRLFVPISDEYSTGHLYPDIQDLGTTRVVKLAGAWVLFADDIAPPGITGKIELTKDGALGLIYHKNGMVELYDNNNNTALTANIASPVHTCCDSTNCFSGGGHSLPNACTISRIC